MKTLDDIKSDLSDLYDEVISGECNLRRAAELANIAGKYLKAAQLDFAKQVYFSGGERPTMKIEG